MSKRLGSLERIYKKKHYTEQIKSLTQPLIQSNFAEHIFNTHHTYTNIKSNLEILHILSKGPKLNTTEQYETYKHYKQFPTNILNDQLHYKIHTLFDTITHASHTNIPTTMNWKMNFHRGCQQLKMVHMAPKCFC